MHNRVRAPHNRSTSGGARTDAETALMVLALAHGLALDAH